MSVLNSWVISWAPRSDSLQSYKMHLGQGGPFIKRWGWQVCLPGKMRHKDYKTSLFSDGNKISNLWYGLGLWKTTSEGAQGTRWQERETLTFQRRLRWYRIEMFHTLKHWPLENLCVAVYLGVLATGYFISNHPTLVFKCWAVAQALPTRGV